MNIKTTEISGIVSAVKDMRNPMGSWDKSDSVIIENAETGLLELESLGENDEALLKKLCRAKSGSGHDCVLKSIAVHCDITATHDFVLQYYRYHHRDTTSSSSKMYCITKGDISEYCSPYVHEDTIDLVNTLIEVYNEIDNSRASDCEDEIQVNLMQSVGCNFKKIPTTKSELFECIIHNTPIGYELTFGEVTNYLQLKTMWSQRKHHRMSSWNTVFVEWVRSLPYSYLITGEEK